MGEVRFLSDDERIQLVRDHIKVASECVEAIRIALHEGFLRNTDEAVGVLDTALNRLACAYDDLDDEPTEIYT